MNEESSGEGRTLDQTPTWAVAGVCAAIVLISIVLEKGLHALGMLLKRKHKTALYEALDKVKEELMVLGFISLFLTFSQWYISQICIPSNVADNMLPCLHRESKSSASNQENGRRLLQSERPINSGMEPNHSCSEGKEPLITIEAAHQLHILIFFLAIFHVFYSAMTMLLGRLKIRGWKNWERETLTPDYELSNHPSRFRLAHETSFVKAHNGCWARTPLFFFYVGCFFRQFFRSVNKSDYLTLRNGFITAHIAPGGKFDFQKYIKRTLEDDFKVVVGISPVLWTSFVIFLLLNVNGWHTLLLASILPLIAILAIGTKLQSILTQMALEITERHTVIQGIPLVQGSDTYFWFSKPRLMLHLLHFTLFQNAFQITYFLWILYEFGLESCFHDKLLFELIKVAMGIGAMILCSYSTLPLYALVTQMGSHIKKNVFDEQMSASLKKWHKAVQKKQGENNKTPLQTLGSLLRQHSSGRVLRRFMSSGHLSRGYASANDEFEEGEGRSRLFVRNDSDQSENEITMFPPLEEITEDDSQVAKV